MRIKFFGVITSLVTIFFGGNAFTRFSSALYLPMYSSTTVGLNSVPRREILTSGGVWSAVAASGLLEAKAGTTNTEQLLADLPMIRLRLPKDGFGREYVCVQLKINEKGPYNFMIDSGLTTEMITPHLQEVMKIRLEGRTINGIGAGGRRMNTLVDLDGVTLCCGRFTQSTELKLPKLHAIITDFPQEHIDPNYSVQGMLGMELLSLFDVDFDFPNNRVRFWKPGTAVKKGLNEIPAVVINDTGLIGIRLSTPGARQPVLAFLDCGASFSCLNWKAATLFGLPPKSDPCYLKGPLVSAQGIDGYLMQLPVSKQTLTFAGEAKLDSVTGKPIGFMSPPSEWTPWDPVKMAIGDIPAFSTLLGDGASPYQGPAALIGLDILSQRRVVFEAGSNASRRRRVFVSPSN